MDIACFMADFVLCGDPEADVRYPVTIFLRRCIMIKTQWSGSWGLLSDINAKPLKQIV